MRSAAVVVAVTALVAALVGASTAHASRYIQKGISDDSQILYGNPDKVFPNLQKLGTQLIRVNLWWGGPNGVASRIAAGRIGKREDAETLEHVEHRPLRERVHAPQRDGDDLGA